MLLAVDFGGLFLQNKEVMSFGMDRSFCFYNKNRIGNSKRFVISMWFDRADDRRRL